MDSKLWAKETLHLENKKEGTLYETPLVLRIEHKLNETVEGLDVQTGMLTRTLEIMPDTLGVKQDQVY